MTTIIEFSHEDEEIKELLSGASTVLQLISEAVANFRAYAYGDYEIGEHRSTLMTFHAASFQYFMIVQFCKLLEQNHKGKTGASSLFKINNKLNDKYPSWSQVFGNNTDILTKIAESAEYDSIKTLRDKCYAHSDKHPFNPSFKFVIMREADFSSFLQMFKSTIKVFQNFYIIYDSQYQDFAIYYNSDRTLKYLQKYRDLQNGYFNNMINESKRKREGGN